MDDPVSWAAGFLSGATGNFTLTVFFFFIENKYTEGQLVFADGGVQPGLFP